MRNVSREKNFQIFFFAILHGGPKDELAHQRIFSKRNYWLHKTKNTSADEFGLRYPLTNSGHLTNWGQYTAGLGWAAFFCPCCRLVRRSEDGLERDVGARDGAGARRFLMTRGERGGRRIVGRTTSWSDQSLYGVSTSAFRESSAHAGTVGGVGCMGAGGCFSSTTLLSSPPGRADSFLRGGSVCVVVVGGVCVVLVGPPPPGREPVPVVFLPAPRSIALPVGAVRSFLLGMVSAPPPSPRSRLLDGGWGGRHPWVGVFLRGWAGGGIVGGGGCVACGRWVLCWGWWMEEPVPRP